jgi:hypothetical protein
VVADALDQDCPDGDTSETGESAESAGVQPQSGRSNPGCDAGKSGCATTADAVGREREREPDRNAGVDAGANTPHARQSDNQHTDGDGTGATGESGGDSTSASNQSKTGKCNHGTHGSAPSYRELYLAARERADADRAYVPHEDLDAVFRAHGWGDLVDHLRHLDDWLVWTPDNRDTPLYAYTPDLAGDTSDQRARLAELFAETGVGTERFIDVHDGQKGSFDTGNARPPEDPEIHGNYGVKGGRGGDDTAPWLVDLDVDDYDTAKDATDAVTDLRDRTLAVASAHTTVDRPGHLYVAVDGDPRAVVRDLLGRAVDNPQASFGEIRVDQQYVVGPGSEVVCGCDRCTDGGDQFGRYELANDRPPVVWTEDEFREFLLSDPKIAAEADRADERDGDQDHDTTLNDDADARLKVAKQADEYVAGALRDARNPDDRSAADAALARSVAPWLNYDERAIKQALDRHGTSKWATRTDDSYRDSVLNYAGDRAVGAYDPMPYWALVEFAVAEGLVDESDLVERDSGTGDVVEDPDQFDGDTYRALPSAEAFNQALDAVEDYGVDHGRDRIERAAGQGPTTNGREFDIEVCEPPVFEPDPFDPEDHWQHLRGDRYDEALDHDGAVIWADEAGSGKTTSSVLGALDRDRNLAVLFDKHEKAREVQTDDPLPDEFDPYHLRGGEQKRHDVCLDADHADEDCPEHGDTDICPSMCPVYDRATDHPDRRRYEAVRDELGDVKAHLLLGEDLPGHGDDGRCPWYDQFDDLETADHVVGVHEYQVLKTVRADRDVIIDESPATLRSTSTVTVEELVRTANAIEDLADVLARDDPTKYTAERFAAFARDLVDELTGGDGDPDLNALDSPTPVWNAYETHDGAAGHYVKREEPTEGWHVAEALARLKVTYTETLVARIRRDNWDGTPLSLDPLVTAAAEAGLSTDAVMQAVAVPSTLDSCPWCGSPVDARDGGHVCRADDCGWSEREHTLTQQDGARARARTWLADHNLEHGTALVYESLPLKSDLPNDPLILDATATPSTVAALYDVDREDIAVRGDDHVEANMHVTQVLDGQYHASTIRAGMTDDDGKTLPRSEWSGAADKIQTTIDQVGDLYDRPLFVAKRELKQYFEFPGHAVVEHYHALRGLNYDECDAVVGIGAPHPDIEDLRREAELLARGTDQRVGGVEHSTRPDAPNPPVYRKLNYTDDQGRGRAVPTKHYTGLVGDLFREAREKEIEQTVHRARPLLADETVDAYLVTNVPTALPVDQVCRFEELTDPVQALLPIRDGAVDLLDAIHDVHAGDGPDGFRPEALVEGRDDGTVANKVKGYHRLARLSGMDVTERTVRNYVDDLETHGLLSPEGYEQHAGVSYSLDVGTLKTALSVLSSNTGFDVAAVRRLRALAESADGTLDWLRQAREVLDLGGDRCEWDPPPSTPG